MYFITCKQTRNNNNVINCKHYDSASMCDNYQLTATIKLSFSL